MILAALLVSPVHAVSIKLFLNYDGSCNVYYYDVSSVSTVQIPEDAIDLTNSSDFISFKTQSFTEKKGLVWNVAYISPFDADLTIRFPAGARVTGGNGEIETIDGLIYLYKDVSAGEEVDIEYSLYAEEESPLLLYAVAVLILLVFVFLLYSFSKKPRLKVEREVSVDEKKLELLPETERKIVEFLLGHDGVTQKDVEAGVSLPKSTVSRVLKTMENKGFVERKKVGLSKKIFLSQMFIEQIKKSKE